MRKLVDGKYVETDSNENAEVTAASPAPAAHDAGRDISKSALALMATQDPGIDWSQLVGTGRNGQVTKGDVEKFIEARG